MIKKFKEFLQIILFTKINKLAAYIFHLIKLKIYLQLWPARIESSINTTTLETQIESPINTTALKIQADKILNWIQSDDWYDWHELLEELKTANQHLFNYLPCILHKAIIQAKAISYDNQDNPIHNLTQEVLELLLEYAKRRWIDVNQKDENHYNYSMLHTTIECRNFYVFQKLLQLNADINATDIDDATPVHIAAKINDSNFLAALLATGKANVNANTINKQTPLHSACYNQHSTNLVLLIKYDAKLSVNALGSSPLIMLKNPKTNPGVDLLWEKEKKYTDEEGYTILHRFCRFDFAWYTQKLLQEPDCQFHTILNNHHQTALHVAAANKADSCIKLLLPKSKMHLDAVDDFGFTALAYAIQNAEFQSVKDILAAGATVAVPIQHQSHMHLAVSSSQTISLLYLKDKESIHCIDGENQIPFQRALSLEKKASIEILIVLHKNSNSINRRYTQGQTLLHMAAYFGKNEIAAALVKQGAEMLQDENGNTPLHIAVMNNHAKCSKFFLQLKNQLSFIDLINQSGQTAFAIGEQNPKIVNLFDIYDQNKIRVKNQEFIAQRLTKTTDNKKANEKNPSKMTSPTVIPHIKPEKTHPKINTKEEKKPNTLSIVSIHSSSLYQKPNDQNYKQKIKWRNLLNNRQALPWVSGQKIVPDMLISISWDDWLGDNSVEKLTAAKLFHPYLHSINHYLKSIIYADDIAHTEYLKYSGTKIVGTTVLKMLLLNLREHPIPTGDTDLLLIGTSMNKFLNHLNQIKKESIWWLHSNYYTYQTPDSRMHEAVKLSVKNESILDVSCIEIIQIFENLEHRNYTILGIALDLTSQTIMCPKKWAEDLISGIIRCIDNPIKSFTDDFSRKIQGLRLVTLGFKFEPETEAAIKKKQKEIFNNIELKATIFQLEKLFQAIGCKRFFELIHEFNLPMQMVASKAQLDNIFNENIFIFNKNDKNTTHINTIKKLKELQESADINGWKRTAETYLHAELSDILKLENDGKEKKNNPSYKMKVHFICSLLMTGADIDYHLFLTPKNLRRTVN